MWTDEHLRAVLSPWQRHEAINQYMLARIPAAAFDAVPLLKTGKPSTGRTVARNWAHLHEVRLSVLRAAEKHLLTGAPVFEKGADPPREDLQAALAASAEALELRVRTALQKDEQIKGQPPTVLLAYFISHESHHRGQMLLALKQSGFALQDELKWGIWEKWFK